MGKLELISMEGHCKSRTRRFWIAVSLIFRIAHHLEAPRQSEGVTVITAGRHAIASCCWVPCRFGPLDTRPDCHGHNPSVWSHHCSPGLLTSTWEIRPCHSTRGALQALLGKPRLDVEQTVASHARVPCEAARWQLDHGDRKSV